MSQPTREEVQAYIDALKYGMKVSHKPEFLIALAEGWLSAAEEPPKVEEVCDHDLYTYAEGGGVIYRRCSKCLLEVASPMRR